jgi:catechol 2,3-dioxygenase-like lactoylglutathione lyase family enzyme
MEQHTVSTRASRAAGTASEGSTEASAYELPVQYEPAGHRPRPSLRTLQLHQHPATDRDDRFDEHRPGLDHLSFRVIDRAELKAWQARLDELGIPHREIVDAHYGSGLSFRDPDNIALELSSPRPDRSEPRPQAGDRPTGSVADGCRHPTTGSTASGPSLRCLDSTQVSRDQSSACWRMQVEVTELS